HYKGSKTFGHGVGYKYPHDFENHFVRQQTTVVSPVTTMALYGFRPRGRQLPSPKTT
ncbi:MAG: hypothetical protein IJR73_02000, partial [Bacteroidales bacterium]|nr:hypothetical protein [Bacteroidales bacterium]